MAADIMRILLLALTLALAGCNGGSAAGTEPAPPLAGAQIGGAFALTDQDGKTVRDSDFAGRYRIMYFGYTFCPDVCPVDVQNIAQGLKLLEARNPQLAARVQPIFVSVDPARDTPPVLKQFVRAFHPRLIGLTGSPEAIADVAKKYAVFYEKLPPAPGATGYLVNHMRATYLMSPEGKPLALLPADQSGEAVAKEIERWAK